MVCGKNCPCQCVKPRKRKARKSAPPRHNPIADLVTALLTQKIQEGVNKPPVFKPEPLETKTASTTTEPVRTTSTVGTMTEQSIRQSMGMQTEPERVVASTQTKPERISAEIQTEPEKAVARIQTEPEKVTTEIQTEPERVVAKTQTEPEKVTTEIQTEPERVSAEVVPRLEIPETETVIEKPASEVQLKPEIAVRRMKEPIEPYFSKAYEKSYNEEIDAILKKRKQEEKEVKRLEKEKQEEEKKVKKIQEAEQLRELVVSGGAGPKKKKGRKPKAVTGDILGALQGGGGGEQKVEFE